MNTLTNNFYWDRFSIILIFKEQCEILTNFSLFEGSKCKFNLSLSVTFYDCCSFKIDLSKKFLKNDHFGSKFIKTSKLSSILVILFLLSSLIVLFMVTLEFHLRIDCSSFFLIRTWSILFFALFLFCLHF